MGKKQLIPSAHRYGIFDFFVESIKALNGSSRWWKRCLARRSSWKINSEF